MKNKLRGAAQRLRELTEKVLVEVTLKVVRENAEYAVSLNLLQLDAGKDRQGFKLPDYSPAYAKKKGRRTPNLKLTGAFWKGFKLQSNSFPLSITSTDEKTLKLVERYGQNIFGLSEINAKKFSKYCQPKIARETKRLIRAAFKG